MFTQNTPGHQGAGYYAPPPSYLRSVSELPACFHPVYANSFRYFNSIQSECYNALLHSDASMVVAAPTGGGKTALLEMAILRLLWRNINPSSGQFQHPRGSLKSIYLAPAKALVQEKVSEWTQKFGQTLGLSIKELTGDTDQEDLHSIDSADIICTTPEKFDAMTRRHRDKGGMRFFNEIALVLIDEVHLLSEGRGACLEAGVVSRIKTVACKPEMAGHPISSVRFLAVSATVPNCPDLAEWLSAPPQNIKVFGDEMRPVKLVTTVKGFQKTANDFLFDRRLTDNIWSVLNDFSRGKPSLVFCASRNGTSTTAMHISREAVRAAGGSRPSCFLKDPAQHGRLLHASASLGDASLRECLASGVGYHHAAMEPEDRAVVEALFRAQDLAVLCTTSTLAVGVNLPAFLVVVKGTRRYAGAAASDPSGYEEYDRSTVLQMIGRAGRPQFDTEGAAVVMTERDCIERYQQLINNAEPVESTLHHALPEYLNAEIALGTINDLPTAIAWLKSTYLYVRIRRAPDTYGVPAAVLHGGAHALERWLKEELQLKTIRELAKHGMLKIDDEGYSIEPLQPGVIMAEQYVKLPTMIDLCKCPVGGGVPQLLWVIARSSELSSIKLRRNEKKVLNAVNKSDLMKYHVMSAVKPDRVVDRISTAADKIFILMTYALADAQPSEKVEYSLKQDAERAVSVGARLTAAMIKYFFHEQRAAESFNALLLHKSLKQKVWTGSRLEVQQVSGVGAVIAERLAGCGITSLRQMAEMDARRLETLAQKAYPWGSKVQRELLQILPPKKLDVVCTPIAWVAGGCVEVEISLTREDNEEDGGGAGGSVKRCPGKLLVGTLHDNALLACRSVDLSTFSSPLQFRVKTKSSAARAAVQIITSAVHETLVGVDMAVKTVIPSDARLDGNIAPPTVTSISISAEPLSGGGGEEEEEEECAPRASEHQKSGGSKPRRSTKATITAAVASDEKTPGAPISKQKKKTTKKDGSATTFMQRKLHEMKGLTPQKNINTNDVTSLQPQTLSVPPPRPSTQQQKPIQSAQQHRHIVPPPPPPPPSIFVSVPGTAHQPSVFSFQNVISPPPRPPPPPTKWTLFTPAKDSSDARIGGETSITPTRTGAAHHDGIASPSSSAASAWPRGGPPPMHHPPPSAVHTAAAPGKSLASIFGQFTFTGGQQQKKNNGTAALFNFPPPPTATTALETKSGIAQQRQVKRPPDITAATVAGTQTDSLNAAAPGKRLKLTSSSLNWLSSKFQAGGGGGSAPLTNVSTTTITTATGAVVRQQQQGIKRKTERSAAMDVSQALGFL